MGFFFVLLRRVVWLRWPLLTLDSRWANAPGGRRGGVAPMAASALAAVGRGRGRHRILPTFSALLPMQPANRSGIHFVKGPFGPKSRAEPPRERKLGAARRGGAGSWKR